MSKIITFNSYVYLIGYGDRIKIGKSNNPEMRLMSLQTGIPEHLKIIGLLGCNSEEEAFKLEKLLHKEYAERNIMREWFDLNISECNYILDNYGVACINLPVKEMFSAMKELSNGAYRLLTYYYSRRDGWTFIDENIAKAIDSTVRQVKKYRKELIDTKYLLIQKGSLDVYFVGKLTVYKYLNDIVDIDDEPMEPIITKGE